MKAWSTPSAVLVSLPRSLWFLADVNECITSSHNCRLGESCINTVGSFRCQRDSSCGTGYELTEDNNCKGETSPSVPGAGVGRGQGDETSQGWQ